MNLLQFWAHISVVASCIHAVYPLRPGTSGCKNERDGGETVIDGLGGPFLVYYVFRSFQRASNAPLMGGQLQS